MKARLRFLMIVPAGLLVTGCLEATAPRIPGEEEPNEQDKVKTGYTAAAVAEPSAPVLLYG